ncbi:MAG: hypothetical protein AVDCRST_MAG93-53 [uncultured Chloroflexia bacterium]|uniref:Uncharacterized protein n=1 Tax=uncultured Chloroflexia bacterium TaxID=1672391 RepID=A0A6J4H0N2_9CHLR|nr:MAG: hypothetical protein AVDCRST_MAG93-53 [uncultured Chloroflexia bacterium]
MITRLEAFVREYQARREPYLKRFSGPVETATRGATIAEVS